MLGMSFSVLTFGIEVEPESVIVSVLACRFSICRWLIGKYSSNRKIWVFSQVRFQKSDKVFCVSTRNRTPKGRNGFLKKTFEKTQDFLNRNRSWMEYHQRLYLHNPYYLWKIPNYFTLRRAILDHGWNSWKKVGIIISFTFFPDGSLDFVRP